MLYLPGCESHEATGVVTDEFGRPLEGVNLTFN